VNLLANRKRHHVVRAFTEPRYRRGFVNGCKTYVNPIGTFWRYVTGRGSYPATVALRTPMGVVRPTLYSHHDVLTVNEIFGRLDYGNARTAEVVVDVGSNIGLSVLFFLTRNARTRVYAFEPVFQNGVRLAKNLAGFEGRFVFSQCAVAVEAGDVTFGVEETGRYGGIGLREGRTSIVVEAKPIVTILEEVLAREGRIDILKTDTEGTERELLLAIPLALKKQIKQIYAEADFGGVNPFPDVYAFRQQGPVSVAQFWRRER